MKKREIPNSICDQYLIIVALYLSGKVEQSAHLLSGLIESRSGGAIKSVNVSNLGIQRVDKFRGKKFRKVGERKEYCVDGYFISADGGENTAKNGSSVIDIRIPYDDTQTILVENILEKISDYDEDQLSVLKLKYAFGYEPKEVAMIIAWSRFRAEGMLSYPYSEGELTLFWKWLDNFEPLSMFDNDDELKEKANKIIGNTKWSSVHIIRKSREIVSNAILSFKHQI